MHHVPSDQCLALIHSRERLEIHSKRKISIFQNVQTYLVIIVQLGFRLTRYDTCSKRFSRPMT